MQELSKWNAPIGGLIYFIGSPSLWWRPLFSALVILILALALFGTVLSYTWPSSHEEWLTYFAGIAKSIGYGFVSILAFWVMGLPLILTYFFSTFIKSVLKKEEMPIYDESFSEALHGALVILLKTLKWRIFWPVASLLATFFLGPLALFVTHLGMSHILAIDGLDLSLSLQGVKVEERSKLVKGVPLLSFAFTSGLIGLLLSFTLIGWLFWFPSMLVGILLVSKQFLHPHK